MADQVLRHAKLGVSVAVSDRTRHDAVRALGFAERMLRSILRGWRNSRLINSSFTRVHDAHELSEAAKGHIHL